MVFGLSSDPAACLTRGLYSGNEGDGRLLMSVTEASTSACDCSRPGRLSTAADVMLEVRRELAVTGVCDGTTGVACADYCACDIVQLAGTASDPSSDLYACQNELVVADPSLVGFCYIDAELTDANRMPTPLGNPELVSSCPDTSERRLRLVGADTPASGALLFGIVYGS